MCEQCTRPVVLPLSRRAFLRAAGTAATALVTAACGGSLPFARQPDPTASPVPAATASTPPLPTATRTPMPPTATLIPQPTASPVVPTAPPSTVTSPPVVPSPTLPPAAPVAVVSRTAWGAAPAVPERFVAHTITRITLHHEGVFFDGSTPAPAYIRAVQNWSLNNRRWGDIPYHFIIDLAGSIYEGRPLTAQGDTNTGYDPAGMALVAVLGDYNTGKQQPNAAQLAAVVAIMAQVARDYAVPPTADSIKGHRDFPGAATTCPGDNLYRYLPAIIAEVAATV